MIQFNVPGTPAPQGSKTARVINGKAIMFEANAGLKAWRERVKTAGELATLEHGQLQGPIEAVLLFTLAKPKTVKRDWPSVKPDLDKLIRGTLDGLTKSGIYVDDAQVVAISATKVYGSEPGCHITLEGVY